jgi:hypothetical protein
MTKDIGRRFVTVAVLVLLAVAGASCIAANSGTPVQELRSPSAVPDPHPVARVS